MSEAHRVLILGGTSEARALADRLATRAEFDVISSLAGRVAQPRLPAGRVRVGGFGGIDGLAQLLRSERIGAVIDATHPFATRISDNAEAACRRAQVPLLALTRVPWARAAGDDWRDVRDIGEAAALAASLGRSIFVTTGRQSAAAFAPYDRWFLIRVIDPPAPPLPVRHELVLQRGPFTLEDERRLMRERAIDVLVSKNSGGDAAYAKIVAARELAIAVVMVQRPLRNSVACVDSVQAALAWVEHLHA